MNRDDCWRAWFLLACIPVSSPSCLCKDAKQRDLGGATRRFLGRSRSRFGGASCRSTVGTRRELGLKRGPREQGAAWKGRRNKKKTKGTKKKGRFRRLLSRSSSAINNWISCVRLSG
ncbi:hypothetical protein C8034_v010953 [Colletotrichum sidae]|uniref:Secreted protein n=1 Tax=Colletotrichum sidae TaxID=1347389 RepID=A0A4R8T1G6_9PEZI|nr:hypothetical protein C8034_v010953 [Colletotrichum sidae]